MSVYAVMIRWVGSTTPDPVKVDAALSPVGDWFRYNAETWFIHIGDLSVVGAGKIYTALERVMHRTDSVLILRLEPSDYAGTATDRGMELAAGKTKRHGQCAHGWQRYAALA